MRQFWLLVFFDLPVDTRERRRSAGRFRHHLLRDGFARMQWSAYVRYCHTPDDLVSHQRRALAAAPVHGDVRLLTITDAHLRRMIVLRDGRRVHPEAVPQQIDLI